MKLIIDLDGVICEEVPTFERSMAKPIPPGIGVLQALHDKGHKIIIYTARGWAEYEVTKAWLENWNIPYDQLIMGKPIGDVWIDDRAIKFTDWETVYNAITSA